MSNIQEIIKPIIPTFVNDKHNYAGSPTISLFQSNTHYSGHYLKYIKKFNELIQTDKTLNKIYNLIINSNMKDKQRMILIMGGIKMFGENTPVYRNASQIYNHELYWISIINESDSTAQLKQYKSKLFKSNEEFNNFYKKFIDLGVGEFGSGWIWICKKKNENKLDVFTTHDSRVPFDDSNTKILGVVDLWEHAYYLDYPADRKKYLEESFKTLNWKKFL
jgi:Fe-Mn family superoxide dismutase